MKIEELGVNNFQQHVLEAATPVLVDFWAPWCGPCLMLSPVLEEVMQNMKDRIKLYKVNIDENPELATSYSVRSIPSLLLFSNGKVKATKIGGATKHVIEEWINNNI